MNHSFSVSELQTVCSVHVADDPFWIVSVHNVRDSDVEVLYSQMSKHCTMYIVPAIGDSVILCFTGLQERFILLR